MELYFIGAHDFLAGVGVDLWYSRIVPNFLVQTGDKTGTGGGGESFYGGMHDFGFLVCSNLRFQNPSRMKFTQGLGSRIED